MKIKGLKKAVGEYQRANSGGAYSAWYGNLMLDRESGDLWTDTFYDIGHNWRKNYYDESIVCLDKWAYDHGFSGNFTMKNVKILAEKCCEEWEERK